MQFEIKARYEPDPSGNGILLYLSTYSAQGDIRYTRGGTEIGYNDRKLSGPIHIIDDETIFAAVYDGMNRLSPFYSQSFKGHKAFGKSVTLRQQPAPAYNNGGAMTLTDGIAGRTPWAGAEWLGWWGDTMDVVIDLGKMDTIHSVQLVTLQDAGSWIYDPARVQIGFSNDGKTFEFPPIDKLNVISAAYDNRNKWEVRHSIQVARYIKVIAIPIASIPIDNPGFGFPAWLFVSEIIVE